ncbi:MAG: hypothetical protein HY864_06680 [Chloroflexi bacterium]|nr:hypothetical protein [Chloroflexota bacterium]
METLSPTLVIIIGLALRVLAPLALTVLAVYFLRKLDARWQAEARNEEKLPAEDEMPCLEIQGLTEEQIKARLSMKAQPCWLARRLPNGYLNEACLNCEVFLNATAPAAGSHARI